jgi:WS/DGAT/MGAT family acyltransferase
MSPAQRLSVLDRTFLDFESDAYPQHVGATLILETGPLRNQAGGIDADRVRSHVESRMHRIPRYRQRLAWIPVEHHPVWIDDDHFNIHYHVRHAALPKPGSERQLKRLAARIMSQRLDYGKPLWELWVIEGLEGDRAALISKTHHCMIDGIAGVDLLTILLSVEPDEDTEATPRWLPEAPPTPLELAGAELWRRATMPITALRGLSAAAQKPAETIARVREQAGAVIEALGAGLVPASNTPLNQDLGPHRRFDWLTFDLAPVREIKKRLGGTVNDVVLATVAGALGDFLELRGVTRARQRSMELRAMVPVSVRPIEKRGTTGNQIALWATPLPIAVTDPRRRLAAISEITAGLKRSKQALGAEVLAAVSEWTVPTLLSLASRVAYRNRASNLVVTNVPGPQVPLFLLGARVLETYPMLNLLTRQSLGVALFSYAGRLHWGFIADWDLVPDLHDFVVAIDRSFGDLCEAAELPRPVSQDLHEQPDNSD